MALEATVNEQVNIVPTFKDDKGNIGKIESVLGWDVSDPAIASIVPAPDALSAKLKPIIMGLVQASIRVDARFGPDVKEVVGRIDVNFEAGEVSMITLEGTVEPLEP